VSSAPPAFGEYEVVRAIATGGMGSVHEVKSRRTGVSYAAKTVLKATDSLARDRFRREAELLARCDRHPGIVKVHAFGETPDGSLYMILDLVRGEGLDALVARERRLAPRRAAEIVRDVARALGFVHSLGVVHRDVKPSNILLDRDGTPKLTDFGLATARDLERLTRTGHFVGTLHYCAPEQALGRGIAPGPRADVYALGCVLFHTLAGEAPLNCDTPIELFARLAEPERIRDVRLVVPDVPEPLAAIVACALAKDPAARFATGNELADDLENYLAGRRISSSIAFEPALARRSVRRALAAVGALALAFVACLALYAVVLRGRRERAALREAETALERVRSVLAPRERAAPPSADDLARALEDARLARKLALEARARGSVRADEILRTAEANLAQGAEALAERELGSGAADKALATLDAVPGAPAALTPEGRLLRARVLFALERLEDASAECEAAAAFPALGARRSEAVELEGDIALQRGEAAKAERGYARALELGARRPSEVRAKRGAAASRAGDDRTALADFAVLVPDPGALSLDRAANARFAGLAPALYRHALAQEPGASERELDLAWRLAQPPAELARPVVDRWLALSGAEIDAWTKSTVGDLRVEESRIARLKKPFERLGRARQVDPHCELRGAWDAWELLRTWARGGAPESVERVARDLLEVWPDEPALLYLRAYPERASPSVADRRECIALLERAIDHYPAPEPDEHGEVRRLASYIAALLDELAEVDAMTTLPVDLDRLRRIAARGNYADAWLAVARHLRGVHHEDEALAILDRLPDIPTLNDDRIRFDRLAHERMLTLHYANRFDEAVAYARSLRATDPTLALRCEAKFYVWGERWQDILHVVDPAQVSDEETLLAFGEALVRLRRLPEARALLPRLSRRPDASDDLKKAIAVAERSTSRPAK
jgi:tRNA A-37 threonylcarbamoyl transferase component Bud32